MAKNSGLKVTRKYTSKGDPYKGIVWEKRTSKIANPDGSVVFEMDDVEIPSTWSQVATDIMVSKYFRKAGVPQVDAEGNVVKDENGDVVLGSETSSRQVFDRLAETWRHWGETTGYFATKDDAQAFEDELKYMLATQMAAPNSPQWFNTGLNHKYDLTGPAQGFWYVDPKTGELVEADDSYSRPQPHACFIQSIDDDLVNEGGIMDLWVKEARLFKFGSGTGTNFSHLRGEGEKLSGGGVSSGVMSFLKIGDRAAGAIKSGGTTRRAAKMVILDLDHPDIETFIEWKAIEEDKARALIAAGYPADFNGEAYATVSGQNSNNSVRVPTEFLKAIEEDGDWELTARTDGSVMLDASIQTCDGRIGFIIAIENTPNPIRVAKALLDEEINGLTGDGARKWADERGFINSPVEGREPVEGMGDTVGVIARDKNGLFACATSTGGCSYRPPGRVGDVPLPGSGFWTEKGISVAATGNGEEITKKLLSYRVSEKISNSNLSLFEGMNWGLVELIDNSKSVGLIALEFEGVGIGVANTDMPWSSWIGS